MVVPGSTNKEAGQAIADLADLAKALAARSTSMREKFVQIYTCETSREPLHNLMSTLVANLLSDGNLPDIADQVAQAITCGLATLRAAMPPDAPFTPRKVLERLPPTHSLIRYLFTYMLQGLIKGNHGASEFLPPSLAEALGVGELVRFLGAPEVGFLLRPPTLDAGDLDPAIHLYEVFLHAYNREKQTQRGVFYTPDALVSCIVRSVDQIVRRECDRPNGFLFPSATRPELDVNLLDPATGTGTFLRHVAHIVKQSFDTMHQNLPAATLASAWEDYVCHQFLPRLAGCEVLLAPFVVAHIILGEALAKTGFRFDKDQRLGVYLANALEAAVPAPLVQPAQRTLDAHLGTNPGGCPPARHEADVARSILQSTQFPVIIGNPPYARKSQNVNPILTRLVGSYKDPVRHERNIQALSDDYLKFLRLAQVLVERAGWGVVGFVLNNRFLTGGVHRGVRESLGQTFDALYVLNLHGGIKGYERVPAGVTDENVFPIAQGVCICLLVKRHSTRDRVPLQVFYHEVCGSRLSKLDFLARSDLNTIPWIPLPAMPPGSPFAPDPVPTSLRAEWDTYVPLEHLFSFSNVGGKPGDDDLLVSVRQEAVIPKLEAFLQQMKNGGDRARARLTEARQKILRLGDSLILDAARVEPYLYRPFDVRWVFYEPALWTRGVPALKTQCRGSLLLLCAKIVNDSAWAHVFATMTFPDVISLSNSSSVNCYVFPIRVSLGTLAESQWNLTPAFQAFLAEMGVDLTYAGDVAVVAYLYAVLSSPTYRTRYDLLLRGGHFPRVPLTPDRTLFARLSDLGQQLLHLHASPIATTPPADLQSTVAEGMHIAPGFPRFEDDQILIAPACGFGPVCSEVWHFVVGKYQVCRQWLTARTQTPLSAGDIRYFLQVLGILRDTVAIGREIDAVIATVGGFPLQCLPLRAPQEIPRPA